MNRFMMANILETVARELRSETPDYRSITRELSDTVTNLIRWYLK